MQETERQSGLASVDVAVALMAAVLAVFAITEFAAPTVEPQPELPTLGLVDETLPAVPPAWAAIQPRTSMALVHGSDLTVLDMAHIAASASDLSLRLIDHPTANMRFNEGRGSEPAKTELTLTFDISDVPVPWTRSRLRLDEGASCEEVGEELASLAGGVVTLVVVAAPETDALAAVGLLSSCGIPLRTSVLPTPRDDGRVVLTLGLSQALFSLELMLR